MQLNITCAHKDADGMALDLRLQGAGHATAVRWVYLAHAALAEFAQGLLAFPPSRQSELRLATYGEHFWLRTFVYDGLGHTALEIFLNQPAAPNVLPAHIRFAVPVEPAALNRLGSQLQHWLADSDAPLVFETPGEENF